MPEAAARPPGPDPAGEDAEQEEEFYESLDRILSSSCSSTSASDDDADHRRRRRSHRHLQPPPPHAPAAVPSAYDVWISEPTSVEERRRLLLQRLGLSSDPTQPPSPRRSPRSPSPPAASPPASPPPRPEAAAEEPRSAGLGKPPLARNPSSSGGEQCRIRNLDDGTEFEVGEVHEEVVREVGTGRQLTLEEFELCVGRSPIVHELMKRTTTAASSSASDHAAPASKPRRKPGGGWLRGIRQLAGSVAYGRRSTEEGDKEKEREARRLSSATDDSLDGSGSRNAGRVRVRQYGKACKELTGLFMTQELAAHSGSVWCINFSLDGRYLATAGEDRVIHVWEVSEGERKGELLGEASVTKENGGGCSPFLAVVGNDSPEIAALSLTGADGGYVEKKRRPRKQSNRKSVGSDHLVVPECVFGFRDKPVCSLLGHAADVLDLSWSKSQYLISSSMDKTVKLWDITTSTCLKTFSHTDYVTCIQFNPVDDNFFISGSLDEKVRIWNVRDRKIEDWNDLHEMVTAACYSPDGQVALVGSHKGSCHIFDTSEKKLQYESHIDLRIRKKKSGQKKITGFQFAPGSSLEVLITSADSRIRVVNGDELVHKFKGFRNTSSQISASVAPNGKYVICASEDSHVYVWRHDNSSHPSRSRSTVDVTNSYEHFHCHGVTVAITWPGAEARGSFGSRSSRHSDSDGAGNSGRDVPVENTDSDAADNRDNESPVCEGAASRCASKHPGDGASTSWPDENLPSAKSSPGQGSSDLCIGAMDVQRRSAWGLVIVTAGRGGEIRVFQNFGFPVQV
ncbi:WD repeat-containing protein 44-like [Panicum miliaceum]|uniref:WD repeat-containing protein 44-like n=1 Tax=Panicum miliaceum TaxID=4540 RepID=A0A3L6PUU7_PANMI|nr:WD repeat-containing protein 44-like [Panicum miliaceum]